METITDFIFPLDERYVEMGTHIGKIYTDFGLPIDMALDHLKSNGYCADRRSQAQVLYGAQNWLIQHRKNSNATDKALDRQRKANINAMLAFIKTGESGIY